MAADTFSSLLGILQMGTGNDNNLWGDNFNSSIGAILERAICGSKTTNVTGGTLDLSAAGSNPPNAVHQMVDRIQIFTGTLTSDQTVIVPNIAKSWHIYNRTTSNGFGLLFKTPSGATISVPAGTDKTVHCDGTSNLQRDDRFDVGMVYDFAGSTPPSGFLECDGSLKSPASFPDLFLRIGTTWGGNGVTTFGLPNLKDTGRFRRSRTNAVAVGTYQPNQFASHGHSATTADAGSSILSAGSHSHGAATINAGSHSHVGSSIAAAGSHSHGGATVNAGSHGHSVNGGSGLSGGADSHSHTITITDSGHAHTVSGTTNIAQGTGSIVTALTTPGATFNTAANTTGLAGTYASSTDGAHSHTVSIDAVGDHAHAISADGNHSHGLTIASDGDHAHTINADGSHTHGFSLALSTSVNAAGGSETRPESAVFVTCIKV